MKKALLILLLLTPALFVDKKPKRNVTVKDSSQPASRRMYMP